MLKLNSFSPLSSGSETSLGAGGEASMPVASFATIRSPCFRSRSCRSL